jgi:hypothetical protein
MLAKQALSQRNESLARLWKNERCSGVRPIQFEAGCLSRDPNLTDRCVRSDDELAGSVLEQDVHDAVIVFELEAARVIFGLDERLLEGFECVVGFAAEGGFVKHGFSVVVRRTHCDTTTIESGCTTQTRPGNAWVTKVRNKKRPPETGRPIEMTMVEDY